MLGRNIEWFGFPNAVSLKSVLAPDIQEFVETTVGIPSDSGFDLNLALSLRTGIHSFPNAPETLLVRQKFLRMEQPVPPPNHANCKAPGSPRLFVLEFSLRGFTD